MGWVAIRGPAGPPPGLAPSRPLPRFFQDCLGIFRVAGPKGVGGLPAWRLPHWSFEAQGENPSNALRPVIVDTRGSDQRRDTQPQPPPRPPLRHQKGPPPPNGGGPFHPLAGPWVWPTRPKPVIWGFGYSRISWILLSLGHNYGERSSSADPSSRFDARRVSMAARPGAVRVSWRESPVIPFGHPKR